MPCPPFSPHTPYTTPLVLTINPYFAAGVIYYQKGDALSAIPYIEMAVKGNKTYEVNLCPNPVTNPSPMH